MELLNTLNRALQVAARRPTFDPKQRMASAAEELNLAGALQAQIGVVESALVAFVAVLYSMDADGRPANYDDRTGRILIPLPWGSSGWKHWGLRKTEAACLRRLLIGRAQVSRNHSLFCFDAEAAKWFLNYEGYPTEDSALVWLTSHGPKLGEWRAIMQAHRDAEAERMHARRYPNNP